MKTIKQWLETLPEPYRSQALENVRRQAGKTPQGPSTVVLKLSTAICLAFNWNNSSEGYTYWAGLAAEAENDGTVEAPEHKAPQPVPIDRADEQPAAPVHKPFDLEAAKAGKPVMMRNGTPIKRILAFDFDSAGYPILATFINANGNEQCGMYTVKGEFNLHGACDPKGSGFDLVMAPETVTKWVNVFTVGNTFGVQRAQVYNTETEAKGAADAAIKMAPSAAGRYVGTLPLTFTT